MEPEAQEGCELPCSLAPDQLCGGSSSISVYDLPLSDYKVIGCYANTGLDFDVVLLTGSTVDSI